ncbi:flagellar biosynthesis, cell-distal portion of basal-body rod [Klebsiella pneumoniae]|uniref:Flagellar biosynthesis, cell-distal portion of basal-body rod n=1 Tax=Klebsiella pneumoniae TaxID=573 RepID=A0A377Y2D7_KLEPN|nr:flagellar biosynthesis, cell-distal portion of basal-body rod [Klebsiella pneumoniae]
MAEVPLPTPTDNPVPSTDIRDAVYAGAMLDKVVTSTELTYTDRLGGEHYTVDGIKAEGDKVVEETRQNLIPLSRQYMTLAAAQADIANIPEGSTTYYRSPDDSALAIEVMNVGGTLEPTGRVMVSKLYIDEIKNRTPNIDRSSYWGGIVAADGTIGVNFRKSDNEPIFGKYGALSALTSSLTPFADIASGMATVNINSSFLVVANGTDGLSVPTIFNKITSTMFVKLFAVTTDEQVADIGRRSGYWGGIVAKNGLVGVVFRESDNRPIFGGGGERGGIFFPGWKLSKTMAVLLSTNPIPQATVPAPGQERLLVIRSLIS